MPDGQLFKLTFHAEGELRDSEGNLISSDPIDIETTVTEEQAQNLIVNAALAEQLRAAEENRDPVSDSRTISREPG